MRQGALNYASVKVCEGLREQAKFLQTPEAEEALLHLLHHTICVGGPFQIVSDVYGKELLHCGPVDVDRGVLSLLSPEDHDQLLCFVNVMVIFLATLPGPSPPPCRLSRHCW